jgi:heat shock protein HtpX
MLTFSIISGMLSIRHSLYKCGKCYIWFACAWFSHTRLIRRMVRSRPLERSEAPQVYNALENLCISRGLPMPTLEIIISPALNAFASGIDRRTYTITVTTGLLEALDPAEIEAVLAHELTHILNEDVRLLIIGVIFVGIISTLSDVLARRLLDGSGRGSDKRPLPVVILGLVVACVGYVLALLIRFSLSRKREYLADAGAVELTKNPEALIQALEKISGRHIVAGMDDEIAMMCIENTKTGFFDLFATHPALESRIAAIRAIAPA